MTMPSTYDTADIMRGLYGDGIIACRGAFSREWVARLGQDIAAIFDTARSTPGGALARGPNRFYVEIHPEKLSGFADIITHPWIVAVCRAVLGPDYRIIEAGFDVPGPGAQLQPWHRDFAAPPETVTGRRLNSLAFNITTVDVTEQMGPLEIAPGTQWDTWEGDPMFPPPQLHQRYEQLRQRRMPQMGDISARSALTVHRGTANLSPTPRPVFVLGVDAPDGINGNKHDLQVTHAYYETLSAQARANLGCRVVERLEPLVQAHTIEGLLMGAAT
ncbi:phytanoyl-CoA dioxygenase family protein [Massilia sp. PAMC28688]|uniref:phytanoyl-CoA dioxygenase family protein n=1 Tax=Massilia sp. PAMC28688 TaxID=2861283 RepID=UPI001C638B55|nr:phytanoyl-CoA dioxygenase family protein [Massilia sp. PAMC28688]QYF93659.1 phytanoyl-CoA dioxygenase family protein [Massilia sp. PAMC28688]